MSPGVRLVALGSPLVGVDDDSGVVAAALAGGGVGLESRTVVDEDETALERTLAPAAPLTVLVAGPGGSTGDVVRRVLARVTGARLVLNERMLAALGEIHRRRDRPLPRRDERLALLPQGAVPWLCPDTDPAWMLEAAGRIVVVLPRGADIAGIVARHLLPFLASRSMPGEAVLTRTLRTAGVSLSDIEERVAAFLALTEFRV